MRGYVLNFWVWWYAVFMVDFSRAVMRRIMFMLQYTNTLVMAQNLGTPLFQDNTGVGKMISWVVRIIWVWGGGMVSAAGAFPWIVAWAVLLVLPVVSLAMLILGVVNIVI